VEEDTPAWDETHSLLELARGVTDEEIVYTKRPRAIQGE